MDDKTEALGPEYDLDLLRERAIAAAFCLHELSEASAAGRPLGAEAALVEFSENCTPSTVLLALYRLGQATMLLDAVKGSVLNQGLRKQVDAFLSCVLTQQDMLLAWPHYAAILKEQAEEAAKAAGVQS